MSIVTIRVMARACALCMLGATSTLANDPIVWDNGRDAPGAASSQQDTVYPFDSQTADDFHLRDQNPDAVAEIVITGVQWTGTYWRGNPVDSGFNLLFYADAGGMPTGGPNDPSETALLNQFIPNEDTNRTPNKNGVQQFDYEAKLTTPFLADPDVTYWLGVQARIVFPPQWGWQASTETWGNSAHQGFPLIGFDYWAPIDGDRSFVLTGVEVPEPGSLAALVAGCALLGRRRRMCRPEIT